MVNSGRWRIQRRLYEDRASYSVWVREPALRPCRYMCWLNYCLSQQAEREKERKKGAERERERESGATYRYTERQTHRYVHIYVKTQRHSYA